MAYNTVAILRDLNGNPIPQYYDVKTDTYKPLKQNLTWLSTDTPPTLSSTEREFGLEVVASTGDTITKYWNGTTWQTVKDTISENIILATQIFN
jgi:hypothetical protein